MAKPIKTILVRLYPEDKKLVDELDSVKASSESINDWMRAAMKSYVGGDQGINTDELLADIRAIVDQALENVSIGSGEKSGSGENSEAVNRGLDNLRDQLG